MDEGMGELMDEWKENKWIKIWRDGWMDGSKEGWIGRWGRWIENEVDR